MRKIAKKQFIVGSFVCLLFLNPGTVFATDAGCMALNSVKVCVPPALPILPPAGQTFTDPTFGTTILRVTDSSDGNDNHNLYASFWPSFNWDSTAFWIKYNSASPAAVSLYTLNPTTLAIKRLNNAQTSMWGGGVGLQDDTLQWHRGADHPNRIYGFGYSSNCTKLYQVDLDLTTSPYNPSNHTFTVLKTFGQCMDYMTLSADNDYFSYIKGTAGNSSVLEVWQRSTDKTWTHDFGSAIHSADIDKSGRFVLAAKGNNVGWEVWEFATDTVTHINYDAIDRQGGHRAMGSGKVYHVDYSGDARTIVARTLTSNPKTNFYNIMAPPGGGAFQEGYVSAFPTDESWLVVTTFVIGGQTVTAPWQGEIIKAWTDNNTTHVQRLAHHRSSADSYYDYPKGNLSFDGKFVMFTSDWEHQTGNRYDVFILRVPGVGGGSDGDINLDGTVDTADVLLAMRIVIGTYTPSSQQFIHGDVAPLIGGIPAPDGVIDIADALAIMRKAMGLISF